MYLCEKDLAVARVTEYNQCNIIMFLLVFRNKIELNFREMDLKMYY